MMNAVQFALLIGWYKMGAIRCELYERRCKRCGKGFYPVDLDTWAYKIRVEKNYAIYFCSWHCLQAEYNKKKTVKKRRYSTFVRD